MADKTADEKLDAIAAHLDSLHKRMDESDKDRADSMKRMDAACAKMDAFEKARADAEKEEEEKKKADAARKDAEDKEKEEKAKADAEEKVKADKAKADAEEEEKKKADAAKADAARVGSNEELKAQIEALSKRLPAVLGDEDKAKYASMQMRCDSAYQAWGAQAPGPLAGETFTDFRVRLLGNLKKHSKVYKDSNLAVLAADEAAFSVIQDSIIADAIAASNGAVEARAPLQKRVTKTDSGHVVTKWVGDPAVAWAPFAGGATKFGRINISLTNKH